MLARLITASEMQSPASASSMSVCVNLWECFLHIAVVQLGSQRHGGLGEKLILGRRLLTSERQMGRSLRSGGVPTEPDENSVLVRPDWISPRVSLAERQPCLSGS